MINKLKLLILFIFLILLGTQKGFSSNDFLLPGGCFELNLALFKSQKINNLENSELSIYWKKEVPYAVHSAESFQVAWIQIVRELHKHNLSSLIPNRIHIYSFGDTLPAPFKDFAAIVCKSQQSKTDFKIFVNDAFLSDVSFFKRKLTHELFHYITQQLGKTYPTWFEEGMALYFENKISSEENFSLAATHLMKSPWMPLEPSKKLESMEDKESFYGHALLFVSYLERKEGRKFINYVLNHPSSNPKIIFPNFNELFKSFQIAKYINQINYMAQEEAQYEKYIVMDGVETNKHSRPRIYGNYMGYVSPSPQGYINYWIHQDMEINVSSKPTAHSYILSIRF